MNFSSFHLALYNWYDLNARALPWRSTTVAYRIWVSEVILQQTQVKQGLPYYLGFLNTFPTVIDLANASEDEVLTQWQGLGYYSRARNMHKAAKVVRDSFGGIFPTNFSSLIQLPGIGSYTAAAVASFSSNEAVGVLDGNVFRFFSRFYGVSTAINSSQGKKEFEHLVATTLDRKIPAKFNQAIMEFGALFCTSSTPNCVECPFKNSCKAFLDGRVSSLPVKISAKAKRTRFLNFLFVFSPSGFIIVKRNDSEIWANLFQLPLIENSNGLVSDLDWFQLLQLPNSDNLLAQLAFSNREYVKHLLSHQILNISFTRLSLTESQLSSIVDSHPDFIFLKKSELEFRSFPAPIYQFLNRISI